MYGGMMSILFLIIILGWVASSIVSCINGYIGYSFYGTLDYNNAMTIESIFSLTPSSILNDQEWNVTNNDLTLAFKLTTNDN